MAHLVKNLKVLPNSKSLDEARHRMYEFFRMACRSVPSIMEIYNLQDVVTPSELRATVSAAIRKNSQVSDPKVIDMLLFKGMEELKSLVDQSKQRHHVIGQYVVGGKGNLQSSGPQDENISTYLKNFYNTNYF